MYVSARNLPARAEGAPRLRSRRVATNVVLLGLTSLFTDLSQEMVMAILPLYLTYELRIGPLLFGLIDGLYQGATAAVRLLGGLIADKRGRYKEVAAVGYGASAVAKLGLLLAGGAWLPTSGWLLADRLGKGVRTAPRDALISLSSRPADYGAAFGVHRSLDTVGALLGPLVAFALLWATPGRYDTIFVASFCIALIGLGILVLFVDNKRGEASSGTEREHASLRGALGLLRAHRFRSLVLVAIALGLLTVSDPFVYLVVQQKADLSAKWFPLLFLGTALSYLLLATPVGRLADRVGRGRVFAGGYVSLLGVYALLRFGDVGTTQVVACLALLGAYYAATDGVLMALVSSVVPEHLRTSGLALVTTGSAAARFASSVVFGALWAAFGANVTILVFLVGLVAVLPAAASLVGVRREAHA